MNAAPMAQARFGHQIVMVQGFEFVIAPIEF
jgi:hypothetical protein